MPSAGIAAVLIGITIASVIYYFFASSEEENLGHNSARRYEYHGSGQSSSTIESRRNLLMNSSGTCSICLEPLTTSMRVVLEPCNHIFHNNCIMEWINTANQPSCPNCRGQFT